MLRRVRKIGIVFGILLVFGLVAAIPALAESPGYYGYGRALPCTDCDLPFSEGVYRLVDINAAARALGLEKDDVSNTLWAGGTLADLIKEQQVDARFVRDAVDAERFRALVNSDYLSDDRPDLCCEGDCCPSACVDSECSCVEACDSKCGGKCDGGKPHMVAYRVTASAGLRLRSGPGTTYSIQAVAPAGTILKSTGNISWTGGWSWVEVMYGGRLLWASAKYLVAVP